MALNKKERERRTRGGSVKNRGEWEVARVLLEDTQDFVRDSFHGKVAWRALGHQDGEREKKEKRSNGDKSGESDESGESDASSESGDSGDSGEIGERGVREKKVKTNNGEILSSLAPLVLIIISLL